jgi:hypothetical protein
MVAVCAAPAVTRSSTRRKGLDMTAVIVSALVVCLVVVVVLIVVVRRLQASVETLSRQVQQNPSPGPASPASTGRRPASGAEPLQRASPAGESTSGSRDGAESPEAVVSITDVSSQPRDDFNVSRVASVTLARPLLKAAALSYGLRRALDTDSRLRIAHAMRKELKQQQKLRRRRAAHRAPSQEWKS